MHTLASYLDRKAREIALLNRCLASPLDLCAPGTPAAVIEQKLQIAAAMRAEQSLASWSVTETARPPAPRWHSGAFEFDYGYQRADLAVRGPAIYPGLPRQTTIYTGSGMSAVSAILVAVLQLHERIEVVAARDCYSETRELMQSFGGRVRVVAPGPFGNDDARDRCPRVLWLDSSVHAAFFPSEIAALAAFELIVFDTSCFDAGSGKIRRVVDHARSAGVPVALVRSHGKLDCLGIEYGRLGSIALVADRKSLPVERIASAKRLAARAREAVRLYGLAPIPVHFPPFAGTSDYRESTVARVASTIRTTRRLARILAERLGPASRITTFQHGLYLTIGSRGHSEVDDVKSAAGALARALEARGLPVKHAGSFGFDFVAVEWYFDALRRMNVMRIAGADLPVEFTDRIAEGIANWWGTSRQSRPTSERAPLPMPATT